MMMSSISRPHAFTSSQRKELELQMLIFNHIVSGNPIPSHLVLLFRRSLLLMDPFSVYPPVSFDRKIEEDPEPWRCRRTDGKKWRCSKEASQESKYCERHMHRGKKCSRKHVEILTPTAAAAAASAAIATPYYHPPPPPPLPSYPYSSAYKSPLGLSFDNDDTTSFRHANGGRLIKEDVQEHNFFSKESSTGLSCWSERSSYPHRNDCEDGFDQDKGRHCFVMGADLKLEKPLLARRVDRKEEGAQKQHKPCLYLFNERIESKGGGSWMDSEEACAKTHLSISIP